MADYDVVIIGGGAAGLTLAHHIGEVNERRGRPLRTALLEPPPGPHTPPPRRERAPTRGPADAPPSNRWLHADEILDAEDRAAGGIAGSA